MAFTRPADPMLCTSYAYVYVNEVLKRNFEKVSLSFGARNRCMQQRKNFRVFLSFIPPQQESPLPALLPIACSASDWGAGGACGHSAWSERDQERRVHGRRVGEGKREEEGRGEIKFKVRAGDKSKGRGEKWRGENLDQIVFSKPGLG